MLVLVVSTRGECLSFARNNTIRYSFFFAFSSPVPPFFFLFFYFVREKQKVAANCTVNVNETSTLAHVSFLLLVVCVLPSSFFLGGTQLLIVEGGSVDRLQANDIEDSWTLVLTEVRSGQKTRPASRAPPFRGGLLPHAVSPRLPWNSVARFFFLS